MAAIKLRDFWTAFTFISTTPSNTVANKIMIQKNTLGVRGFIGTHDPSATSILGGICWGSGDPANSGTLSEVIFEIEPVSRKTKINLIAYSNSLTHDEADKIVESFFQAMVPKVLDKMIRHLKRSPSGGRYRGRRMEAHRRGNAITVGDFFDTELNNLFTADFIKQARKLTITYR